MHYIHIDYRRGLRFKDLLGIAKHLKMPACESKLAFLIRNCFECFEQRDCAQVLINPLVVTKDGYFRAANPTIEIDDNSLYRQAEMATLRDDA